MLHGELVGGPEVVRWARQAKERLARAIQGGLRKGAAIIASNAKRIVYAGRPEHLEGDTGRLRQSLTYQVEGDRAIVGTNVKYGAIHEYGGWVRAVNATYLAIPVGDRKGSPRKYEDLHFVPASGEGLLVDDQGRVQYQMRHQVYIPARPYLHPAAEQSMPQVREAFLGEVAREMGK
jgi:phage gpG-like protein